MGQALRPRYCNCYCTIIKKTGFPEKAKPPLQQASVLPTDTNSSAWWGAPCEMTSS